MAGQLIIGSIIVSVTIILHIAFLEAAISRLKSLSGLLARRLSYVAKTSMLVCATLWVMASHGIGVWIWAFMFALLGAIDRLEPAVYFSLVAFTTLGFGDITLGEDWRILSAICAANGLLLFGFSTAFLVELMRRLQDLSTATEDDRA